MSLYGNLAITAGKLLSKYGMAVTLRKKTASAYDPSTGSAAGSVTDYTGTAVKFEKTPVSDNSGTLVVNRDTVVYLSITNVVAPEVNDTLLISSQAYTIKGVDIVAPAGSNVVYILNVG
jgi:hypothetical protein